MLCLVQTCYKRRKNAPQRNLHLHFFNGEIFLFVDWLIVNTASKSPTNPFFQLFWCDKMTKMAVFAILHVKQFVIRAISSGHRRHPSRYRPTYQIRAPVQFIIWPRKKLWKLSGAGAIPKFAVVFLIVKIVVP